MAIVRARLSARFLRVTAWFSKVWSKRSEHWSRLKGFALNPAVRAVVAAALVLTALTLGFIGLHEYLAERKAADLWGSGIANTIFYDLALLVFASAPTASAGPLPVLLGIARILAPVTTFLAAIGAFAVVLGEQWRRVQVAIATKHAIVAGDGPVALEISRNLRAEKRRKVILVSPNDVTLSQARRVGVLTLRGDPADMGTLRSARLFRAAELFACTEAGNVNIAITLGARGEVPADARRPLSAYALVRDVELAVSLRARRIGSGRDSQLRLDFFAVEDIAARKLLDEYPLTLGSDGQAHVLISGLGKLGQAVLREVARRHEELPGSRPVDVVIQGATHEVVDSVTARFPVISPHCSITLGDTLPPLTGGKYTAYACLTDEMDGGGDDGALREGLAIADRLAGQNAQVVICMRDGKPFGHLDAAVGKLVVFGILQNGCGPADIRDDVTERIARSIHASYRHSEQGKGETEATNPSMVPWKELSQELRKSNIGPAEDIGRKMEAIHAVVVPESRTLPPFSFRNDAEIWELAQLEHERWRAEKEADGWTWDNDRVDRLKTHPDLLPWAELTEKAKRKNYDAIVGLPDVLRNAGFQVLRLPGA
jgi:TrkA-N domain/RyR domain